MSSPEPVDGRRLRGAVSRAAIIDAATQLFSTRGYAGTGMAAIATRAGVHSNSIYHAFGSKQGLLDAVMTSVADRTFATVETISHDASTSLGDRLRQTAHALVADPVFLRLFLLLALEKVDDADVRASVEAVRTRARATVSAAVSPLLDDLDDETRAVASDLVERIALVLLDGLFVSHQLDSESADLEQTLDLVTAMAEVLLGQLPALLSPSPKEPA